MAKKCVFGIASLKFQIVHLLGQVVLSGYKDSLEYKDLSLYSGQYGKLMYVRVEQTSLFLRSDKYHTVHFSSKK